MYLLYSVNVYIFNVVIEIKFYSIILIKSVLALLCHVLAVKYKKMRLVLVKIPENLHILG